MQEEQNLLEWAVTFSGPMYGHWKCFALICCPDWSRFVLPNAVDSVGSRPSSEWDDTVVISNCLYLWFLQLHLGYEWWGGGLPWFCSSHHVEERHTWWRTSEKFMTVCHLSKQVVALVRMGLPILIIFAWSTNIDRLVLLSRSMSTMWQGHHVSSSGGPRALLSQPRNFSHPRLPYFMQSNTTWGTCLGPPSFMCCVPKLLDKLSRNCDCWRVLGDSWRAATCALKF